MLQNILSYTTDVIHHTFTCSLADGIEVLLEYYQQCIKSVYVQMLTLGLPSQYGNFISRLLKTTGI